MAGGDLFSLMFMSPPSFPSSHQLRMFFSEKNKGDVKRLSLECSSQLWIQVNTCPTPNNLKAAVGLANSSEALNLSISI